LKPSTLLDVEAGDVLETGIVVTTEGVQLSSPPHEASVNIAAPMAIVSAARRPDS